MQFLKKLLQLPVIRSICQIEYLIKYEDGEQYSFSNVKEKPTRKQPKYVKIYERKFKNLATLTVCKRLFS